MKKIFTLCLILFLCITIDMNWQVFANLFHPSSAYAVGDLTIDWGGGVLEGQPIFTLTNFKPGDSVSHTVHVHNGATIGRPVGVRGVKMNETGNLGDQLLITVKQNTTIIYGPKTLSQFFTDTLSPTSFVPLSVLSQNTNADYIFMVTFNQQAGNDFQGKTLSFDLHMGIAFTVPQACSFMQFKHEPIFGTEGNDALHGVAGNNLIISFNGKDVITGGSGQNCIVAGNGNNTLFGGAGRNVIISGNGNNTITGGANADVITAGIGKNTVLGGAGADIITVGQNNTSTIDGGAGKDTCSGTIHKTNCEL